MTYDTNGRSGFGPAEKLFRKESRCLIAVLSTLDYRGDFKDICDIPRIDLHSNLLRTYPYSVGPESFFAQYLFSGLGSAFLWNPFPSKTLAVPREYHREAP